MYTIDEKDSVVSVPDLPKPTAAAGETALVGSGSRSSSLTTYTVRTMPSRWLDSRADRSLFRAAS